MLRPSFVYQGSPPGHSGKGVFIGAAGFAVPFEPGGDEDADLCPVGLRSGRFRAGYIDLQHDPDREQYEKDRDHDPYERGQLSSGVSGHCS